MKYVSVAQMQAIEREANAGGLTYEIMMENAGQGLAEVILDKFGYMEDDGVLGLVGSGNNGGDTLVALAHLAEQGWKATAAILRTRPDDDPLTLRLEQVGGRITDFSRDPDLSSLGELVKDHALLLDGVLGTGIKLPLRGSLAELIDFVRRQVVASPVPPVVVAVDCPSGMDCDTGEAAEQCIPALQTVTMAAVKHGLLKFPAYNLVGDLDVVEIGLPEGGQALQSWRDVNTFVPDNAWVHTVLPPRPLDSHKGTFGTALIVAGSTSFTGAALLAGQSAYRVGAGLVTLAVPEVLHTALSGHFPEATWLLLPHQAGFISSAAAPIVLQNLDRITAMLVGCGFGLADTTGEFIDRLLDADNLPPLVFDADGLKLLKKQPDWSSRLPSYSVLTPHPGEMSILCGLSVSEIQSSRLETALRFSQSWGHVVVLKGAFTVIASPDGQAAVIPVASPSLARAGTGDVLAGLITGLRAQGVPAFESAVAAAWIQAGGGLKAAASLGTSASVLAGDVLYFAIQVLADLA
jgi:hydroxyethylthiazole kinase-like uncharacterized protein yjeF